MTKYLMLFWLFFGAQSVLSAQLKINVRDVMDLASYEQVLTESMALSMDKKESKSFLIKRWKSCFDACENYAIKLSLEAMPVENKLIHTPSYLITAVKELWQGNRMMSVLMRESFVLTKGQEKIASDIFWDRQGELIVRQESIFSLAH